MKKRAGGEGGFEGSLPALWGGCGSIAPPGLPGGLYLLFYEGWQLWEKYFWRFRSALWGLCMLV